MIVLSKYYEMFGKDSSVFPLDECDKFLQNSCKYIDIKIWLQINKKIV